MMKMRRGGERRGEEDMPYDTTTTTSRNADEHMSGKGEKKNTKKPPKMPRRRGEGKKENILPGTATRLPLCYCYHPQRYSFHHDHGLVVSCFLFPPVIPILSVRQFRTDNDPLSWFVPHPFCDSFVLCLFFDYHQHCQCHC